MSAASAERLLRSEIISVVSAERLLRSGSLGGISYVYICRALPITWNIVFNLVFNLLFKIDLILVTI